MPPTVSVIVPTQRRPAGLQTAVRSIAGQKGVDLSTLEVLVVDNDAADTARDLVGALARAHPQIGLRYVHERTPGVASARNAGLAETTGPWIAFLDDDEEAEEGWLAALLSAARAFEADVVFGPVRGRAPAGSPHRDYFEAFFSRFGPAEDGLIARHYGCGNSLVRRSAVPDQHRPFDTAFDRRGGEDDVLFSVMRQSGARFAWAAGAIVWEDPAPARLSLRYVAARAFAHGQGATTLRAAYGSSALVAWSVLTGAAQAMVFGGLAALAFAVFAPRRAFLLDRAARGLGKVLWSRPFHIAFYGLRPGEAGRGGAVAVN